MTLHVFISSVTDRTTAAERRPDPLRSWLIERLQKSGSHLVYQESLIETGVNTLVKLAREIELQHVVIHIVTGDPGRVPSDSRTMVELLRHCGEGKLRERFKELFVDDRYQRLTYTQWEAWLGKFYERDVVCFCLPDAERSKVAASPDLLSMQEHLAMLKPHAGYAVDCDSREDLLSQIQTVLLRHKNNDQSAQLAIPPRLSIGCTIVILALLIALISPLYYPRLKTALRSNEAEIATWVTVVESDDGSPVLGLKNLPDNELKSEIDRLKVIIDALKKGENDKFSPQGEFARIMSRRVYLPSGTPVTLLEDPMNLPDPVRVPGQSPADGNAATSEFQFGIEDLFSKVRVGEDSDQPMDLYVPSDTIRRRSSTVINAPSNQVIVVNQSPKLVRKMILSNDGGATLILRENIGELTDAIGDPNQHLGIAVHGTEVKLLDGKKNFGPIIEFRKIEILSGEFKGKRGWVSKNVISEIDAPESDQK